MAARHVRTRMQTRRHEPNVPHTKQMRVVLVPEQQTLQTYCKATYDFTALLNSDDLRISSIIVRIRTKYSYECKVTVGNVIIQNCEYECKVTVGNVIIQNCEYECKVTVGNVIIQNCEYECKVTVGNVIIQNCEYECKVTVGNVIIQNCEYECQGYCRQCDHTELRNCEYECKVTVGNVIIQNCEYECKVTVGNVIIQNCEYECKVTVGNVIIQNCEYECKVTVGNVIMQNCEYELNISRLSQRRTGLNPRPGHSRIFATGKRTGRWCWSTGFLGDLPVPSSLNSGSAIFSPHFTLIGSQYLAVKSHPNFSTQQKLFYILLRIKPQQMPTFKLQLFLASAKTSTRGAVLATHVSRPSLSADVEKKTGRDSRNAEKLANGRKGGGGAKTVPCLSGGSFFDSQHSSGTLPPATDATRPQIVGRRKCWSAGSFLQYRLLASIGKPVWQRVGERQRKKRGEVKRES
ncbi:hypothetical protein PR048_017854 [Dryococelus australis]|uniref:Uncharacterized protein n=1 Tax=Dryococelus australis TaxID=614101 RepID=A0ABQ9HAR9_9NEOP|nr:hypothetical protein PR048_017854 [Dryococelus australis]